MNFGLQRTTGGFLACAALLFTAGSARAEEWIIKQPGEHPHYSLEIEPEVIFVFNRKLSDGPGAGVRASIPLMHNGFVPSINNSIAITFGADKDPLTSGKTLNVPVALQWNFWLSQHWSVCGEPGVFVQFDENSPRAYLQIWGGARYHLSPSVALMTRVTLPNAPAFSLGVSFFL